VKLIGHRGACGIYPENTLLSIRKAVELGVDGVEFDVRRTKDGVLIVFHDERLDRLTSGRGYVRERNYDYISKLKVKGEPIPKLSEVLEYLRGARGVEVFVEVKEPDTVGEVMGLVESYGLRDRTTIISFYHTALQEASRRGWRVGPIFVCRPLKLKSLVADLEPYVVLPRYDMIDRELVEEAHEMGAEVVAWVVNDLEVLSTVRELGVDWIASDYPNKMINLLRQSRLEL